MDLSISKLVSKYSSKYLDNKVILAMDMFLSVASSCLVLLLLYFITGDSLYSGYFAIWWFVSSIVFSGLSMYSVKSYRNIIRHTTLRDTSKFALAIAIKEILMGALLFCIYRFNAFIVLALFCDFLLSLFVMLCTRLLMIAAYDAYSFRIKDAQDRQRVLIYGTGENALAAFLRFKNSDFLNIIGFISRDFSDDRHSIAEYPVFSFSNAHEFKEIVHKKSPEAVLFLNEDDVRSEEDGVVKYCSQNGIKALITPSVDEVIDGKVMQKPLRQVRIEDLLGRPEIKISLDNIRQNFSGKVVMVTGAAGSIGSELCRQLAGFGIKRLILYDNAETPMHNLRLELETRFPKLDFIPIIGSVRHEERLEFAFKKGRPDIVFHAAAYKHVPLMEENPCEAVFANVYGSRLVADKCVVHGVEMMVMISTDKAVRPTNIMGCSKRLAEIYVQSLGLAMAKGEVKGKTKFVTTRFGNVLGSNGSVIPRFREQIEKGGPVTVTDPKITRFFMTIPEACRLVMEAATLGTGNQIFVFDMGQSVKIVDMATKMIELAGYKPGEDIKIEFTGLRPGEKLYEEVLANTEETEPTSHAKIRIARVREYPYAEAAADVEALTDLAKAGDIEDMVILMKKIVPEFKSKNSPYEKYDK